MRVWTARALAAVTGGLTALALPAAGAWWLAWVGLVPLLLLSGRAGGFRDAAWLGWSFAVGYTAIATHWLLPQLGVFAVPALALAALTGIPLALAAHGLLRNPPSPGGVATAVLVLPSVHLLVEVARSWHHLGGGWTPLGLSQWSVRPVLAVASLGGVWLIGFVLVAVNVGLAVLVETRAPPPARRTGAVLALAVVAATVAFGLARTTPPTEGALRVAGVQPGVVDDNLRAHLRHTAALADADTDVVVWGQSSVPVDPGDRPDVADRLRHTAARVSGDLLVNVDARQADGRITKATHHYRPEGVVATYHKRRLAPFGEYVPLRPVLGPLTGHTGAADVDRATGDRRTLLRVDGTTLGPLISYESVFADLRRDLARAGADVIVVQGSLTTFHDSWAQAQQAAGEAVRAVESGRASVLVSTSGTSAAFDAAGRELLWRPPGHPGTFVVTVPRHTGTTPFVRWGDWLPPAAGGVVAGFGLAVAVRTRPGHAPATRPGPVSSGPVRPPPR